MADKKKVGSKLLAALGRTKKEQMAKLYPKAQPKAYPKIKSKGPYTRGTIGKKGTSDFLKRRAAVAGTKATKSSKLDLSPIASGLGAGATGYAIGKGWHKKLAGAVTKAVKKKDRPSHQDRAREAAAKGIKKQKTKKEKRKSHH